jgi:hypothetical protein
MKKPMNWVRMNGLPKKSQPKIDPPLWLTTILLRLSEPAWMTTPTTASTIGSS